MVFGLFLSLFFALPEASAVQIKKVQTGDVYFDTDDISQTVPIQAVDQTKTLILVYPNVDYNTSNYIYNSLFTVQFEADNSIVLNRDGANTGAYVRYYIIEFTDGVFVQRGISSFIYGNYNNTAYRIKEVILPTSIDPEKSFAVVNTRFNYTSSAYDEMTLVTGEIFDEDTMILERSSSYDANRTVNIVWQVVEFQTDAIVQSGNLTMPWNATSATVSLTDDPTDGTFSNLDYIPAGKTDKCWLFYQTRARANINGVEGRYAIRGDISAENQLTFTRAQGDGTTVNDENYIRWYLIRFTDESTKVQKDSVTVAAASDLAMETIPTAVDPSRAFPFIGVSGQANTTATYEDDIRFQPEFNVAKGVAFQPDGTTPAIWVAGFHSNKVYKFNADTGAYITSVTVGTEPVAVCYDSENDAIWVANYGSNNVTRINADNATVDGTVAVGTGPTDICFETITNSVWTANYVSATTGSVSKVDASAMTLTSTGTATYGPTSICWDQSNNYIWICYWTGTNTVQLGYWTCADNDLSNGLTARDIGNGSQAYTCIRYAPTNGIDGQTYNSIWVASLRYNFVMKIRCNALGTYYQYYPELAPSGMTWDPTTNRMWIANYASNKLTKMKSSDGTSDETNPDTDTNPFSVCYAATATPYIWVSNASARTLQRFDPTDSSNEGTFAISTSEDQLALKRANTANSSDINWQVIEFAPITVKSPNGGEVWHVGADPADTTITWKHADSLAGSTVDILLSQNGGTTYPLTITTGVNATADAFAWTIDNVEDGANPLQDDLRVRIIKTGTTTTDRQYDDSNGNFEIKGTIAVTQPNGGQTDWYVGDKDKKIQWSKTGDFDPAHDADYSFNIYLSEDGGDNYNYTVVTGLLQADVACGVADDTCEWTWDESNNGIPDKIGADRKIKVALNGEESAVNDVSDAVFSIRGVVTLTAPNGGQTWLATESNDITWTKKGSIASFTLKYSLNSGADYLATIDSSVDAATYCTGDTCTYPWNPTPEAAIGTAVRIKVISNEAVGLQVEDASDANLTIAASVQLDTPTGVDVWTATEGADITWTVHGVMDYVHLWWSADNGVSWTRITGDAGTAAAAGSYHWNSVAEGLVGTTCRICVSKRNGSGETEPSTVKSVSAAFVSRGKLILSSFDGGEMFLAGSAQNITWDAKGIGLGNVRIYYAADGSDFSSLLTDSTPASDETFPWPALPLTTTNTGKVKIELFNEPLVNDTSAGAFIIGTLVITTPDGDESWTVDASENIVWDSVKFTGNAHIYYSDDGGTDNYPHSITTVPVALSEEIKSWTIPDAIGTNLKVKIVSVDAPAVFAVSPGTFVIKGGFNVSTPAGTDKWEVGTQHNLDWVTHGTINNVDLYWNTNNGAWTQFGNDLSNGIGYANWTVPDAIGINTKIKVTNADGTVSAESAAFTVKGKLQVTAPVSGDVWYKGDTNRVVSWFAWGTVTNVKIEYKTSLAGGYTTIVANDPSHTAGNNSYTWAAGVADEKSETCYIRVSDANNAEVEAVSDAFSIRPKITVSAPVVGTDFTVGSDNANAVQWSINGSTKVSTVNVVYSTAGAGGPFDKTIASGVTAGDGQCNWDDVGDYIGNNVVVRVVDTGNSNVWGNSGVLGIKGSITLSQPVGSEDWKVGETTHNIVWGKTGTIGTVKIYADYGSGYEAVPVGTADAEAVSLWNWTPIPDHVSNTVKVKITDGDNEAKTFIESNVFHIVGGFTISQPGTLYATDPYTISWTASASGISKVKIDFYNGTSWSPVATDVNNDGTNGGSYAWTVPANTDSTACKLRVTSTTPDQPASASETAAFTVKVGKFTVSQPNTLITGDAYTVSWTSEAAGVSKVKIEFYNGSGWSDIATNQDNSGVAGGSYGWTVPGTTNSAACKLRVTATTPAQAGSASETNAFWVHGKIEFTGVTTPSPTVGEMWTVGQSEDINFKITGKIDNVDILYSKTGGEPYSYPVTSGLAVSSGENSHSWSIPTNQDILTKTQARIKIQDSLQTTVVAQSPLFGIKGTISVTAPVASDIFTYGGAPTNITWTYAGLIQNVKMSYSTNGLTYDFTINSGNAVAVTPSSFAWSIPDKILGDVVSVKVEDADNDQCYGVSGTFEIVGQLTLVAPVGGEKWSVGSTQNILWTPTGTFTTVRIEASADDFTSHMLDITRPAGATGVQQSYGWVIPSTLSNTMKVRVSDPDHHPETVKDVSDATFKILGSLDVTAPEAGQAWYKGETNKVISWDAFGTVTNVKIEYKTSGGGAYTTIVANDGSHTAGPNTYTWSAGVADENSETCYIRVSDATNYDDVYSVSAAPFSIRPVISVTHPLVGSNIAVAASYANAVKWSLNGSTKVSNVDIVYSTNGTAGPFDKTIATSVEAALGQKDWNIVSDTISGNVVVKVMDSTNNAAFGYSPVFNIVGQIAVQQPAAGVDWFVGATDKNITWTKQGTIGTVNIYADYNDAQGYQSIATGVDSATGLWNWPAIPDKVNNAVKVKVTDADNEAVVFGESAAFHIAATFAVTAPVNGNVWKIGESKSITWTCAGTAVSTVKLEYSTNGFVNETATVLIAAAAPNTLTYSWPIPDAITTSGKVRVSDPANSNANALSGGLFSIMGTLTVTSPNAGTESWDVGSTYPVTWTKTGSIPTIDVYYSHNNGTDWAKVNTVAINAALGTWNWAIDEATELTSGKSGLVRVMDTSYGTVYDDSNLPFELKGQVTVNTPSLNNISMLVGDAYNITWTKYGAVNNVQLHYSINGGIGGGGSYLAPNLIATVVSEPSSYSWTVPDAIGTNLRVRVRDAANANVWDESNNPFTIRGKVHVDYPNGGETFLVGETKQVKWTPTGTYSQVKLEYSTNAFADESQTVVVGTVGAGDTGEQQSYDWTVPDKISTSLKMRISDANDALVSDVSDATFTIKGALTLTSPTTGVTWIVGESQNITWTRNGSVALVKLEYSTDGGGNYTQTIAENVAGGSSPYPWTIPDAIDSDIRVRVSDMSDGTVKSESGDFTIKGKLTLTAPNGGEVLTVDDNFDITWTRAGSIANVKLEYSTNGFSSEAETVEIVASTNATGTPPASYKYTWAVPDAIDASVKVRISNAADPTVTDVSNNLFKIQGSFTLTAPNGAEKWSVGSGQSVTWTKHGSIVNAKLELSKNSGSSYPIIITNSTPAGGLSYSWTIPDQIATQCRVRISDADDATVLDASNADFVIMGTFTVTAPNGSEVWVVNTQQNIAWSVVGTVSNVKLSYSTDGGGTYPHVIIASTENSSPYNWTIPDAIYNTCRVRVADAANDDAFDISNGNFKIKGVLTVVSPNGTEVWPINSGHNITWSRVGSVANVKIEYSTNGFTDELQTYTIIASTPGVDLSYLWTVEDTPSSNCKVRITDVTDATVFDVSNAAFRITGNLTVTYPNGGEELIVNEVKNITWTKFGSIASVKVQYSTDGGSTYPVGKVIIASTSASNLSYSWTLPDDISSQCRVKISDVGDDSVADQSDANFTIKGSVTLTAPNGGQNWIVGANEDITWTRNGSFANVKLEYSIDNFTTPVVITASTNATGTPADTYKYTWSVADAISTNVKVRISDALNSSVSDVSDAAFTIKGALSLTSPTTAVTWLVGESRNITWTRTGSIANVKLEYSINGGGAYPNVIIASTPAGTGSYGWTVADAIGGDVRVRVSDALDATVKDESDVSFTIKGVLTLTAPNTSVSLVVDDPYTITWTRAGSISTVKLEYSTNAFADEAQVTVIAASTDATTGSYAWTVPDAIGTTLKVRVTNTADDTVKDVSDTTFSIIGSVLLTAPNGTEQWVVGDENNVTWTKHGSITAVKLELSKDGGTTWPVSITNSTPGGGLSYAWTIPDQISTQCRVRISDTSNVNVVDTSDANFAIRGGFTVTSPTTGSEVWVVAEVHDITWSSNGTISNVKLDYSTNGGTTYDYTIIASTPNTNSYSWTIPDAIAITCKVRVSDASNANAFDESNNNFKIKGALRVTSPNAGTESWSVGYSHPITWERTGQVQSINIYYSANAGGDWTKINGAVVDAALGTWSWDMSADTELSTTALIRIIDASDATVTDTSNNQFTVKGGLRVETPSAAGISLQVGNSYNITWSKFGNIAQVKIHYSTNGGDIGEGTYPDPANLIAIVDADELESLWAVPDRIGTNLRIRVMQSDNANVWDESDNAFEIKGKLQVLQPNGGEIWFVGDANDLQWRPYGTFTSQVKLEYSTNGFANEAATTLIATVPAGASEGTSTYSWTIPNAIGSGLKVRTTDANNATVTDVSDSTFTIKGKLLLQTPNGGETWVVGTVQNITWQTTGTIANVKLEYSINNGATYPNVIVASTDGSTGSYPWTIPSAIGTNLRVRISDVSDATVEDVSNATFTVKGALLLTAPNGAEAWQIGSTHNITWTRTGAIANVKLSLSIDGITYPTTIVATTDASTGSYAWLIPDNPGNTTKVKVEDVSDSTVFDISDANFKIIGSFTLTEPNGGEAFGIGTNRYVRWTKTGSIANAKIQYSTNGGANYDNTIIASTPAGGLEYEWTVADTPTTTARVKISDASDVTVFDTSDANFRIQGVFGVTAPNGSEVLTVGGTQTITWSCVGSVTNVKLQYSTNGGSTYDYTIADSIANSLEYSWTVPDSISTQVRVRVADVNDDTAADASNGNFKIKGAVLLTSPNGTENWIVGSSHDITWTRTGSVATVRLDYSKNGGSTYVDAITASVNGTGDPAGTYKYAWTIPDAIGTQLRVRIMDTSDSTVLDQSDANFNIKGALTVTSPNGGQNWIVSSAYPITWTRTGAIAAVKIDYSKNSGSTFPNPVVASTDASTGTYSWTIPDDLSTAVRVRVMDAADSSVFDASDADFAIGGAVTLNAPNGGQIWYVGAAQNVTWTRFGSIPQVKLEYSINGGFSYTNTIIAATDAAAQTYAWAVADAIGDQVRVRVTDTTNAAVTDESDANFTIKGILLLTSPNGAETWIVGEARNVVWSRTGSIANVKLEYSTDNGTTYPNTIVASTDASTGAYLWTVPDSIGANRKVKVSDVLDASVFDVSDAGFTVKGSVTVTAPNGGEAWGVGTQHAVTWTRTGSFLNVKIEYSTDGGVTYPSTIAASTDAAAGTYNWTIPDDISSGCKVRVSNVLDSTVADVSDTNFKIVGILNLTSPVGGERWIVATNHNITWTRSGTIANVKLEYSINGGGTYPNTIVASTPGGSLSFTWPVPDNITKTARVRISDVLDSTVLDTSDANFVISAGFTLSSPNGGEVLPVAGTHNIAWAPVGSATTVRLDYSTDGGSSYDKNISTSTANSGSFSWTVPDTVSAQCKVMVSDYNDIDAFDVSDANFKIRGDLVVTAPNGGEAWAVGTAYNITWTKAGSIANIKIEYSTDGGTTYPNLIVASTNASALTYSWTVPDTLSTNCRVRITDTGDAAVFDSSNASFKIRGAFTLTAPNGGEIWEVGTVQNVTWTMVGSIVNAKLEYSTDGGSSYVTTIVATTDASAMSYPWLIPNEITTQLRVRISDVSDASVYDASNANFKIKGVLRITAPNGGEDWDVGVSNNITWVTTGSVTSVRLDYSTDSGTTFPGVIVASTPAAAGTYAWTVPDAISVDVRVKITNLSDATVNDVSDADFKIKGRLTVTAPNGGEVWGVGSTETVGWSRIGSFSNVKIDYSVDSGGSFPNPIVASTPAAAGGYSWTIPDNIKTTVRVRVSDAADSTVFDISNADFKIRGNLLLTAPNGTEVWLISSSQAITWVRYGSISKVRLDYSKDGGSNYSFNICTSQDAGPQTYNWSIPDNPGTAVRVKITDEGDNTVYDSSNANFTIRGGFQILAPNGGEAWTVNSSHGIAWTTFGSYANVKIWYSKDNGSTWDIVNGNTLNSSPYVWTIPDAISTQCLVKIADVIDVDAVDTSDAAFIIRGQVNITSPNGGEAWGVGSSQTITWNKTGTIPSFKLEYSTNAFADESQTHLINGGIPGASVSYSWTVPDVIGTNLKIRVSDATDTAVTDVSDNPFRVRGALTVTAPNGGEAWIVGSSHSITWNTGGTIANVKVEYSTDAGSSWTIIAASAPNINSYAWTVPDAISSQCRVRVSDFTDSDASDTSNANFKIRGDLVITAPNGGEKWAVGTTKTITWTRTGSISNMRLEYSDNGGTTYAPIVASTTGSNYSWTVPDAITIQALVRIYDVSDMTVTDVSDATFKIQGSFTVTSPNGGEAWQAATENTITWTSNGSVNFVRVDYSKDSGVTWNEIVASTANDGEQTWFIPVEAVSVNNRIRVADAGDVEAFDMSNNDFRVRCSFTLTAPNGGEKWRVGRAYNIAWTKVGNPANVKLEFSRDNFVTDFNTIAAVASPVSPYSWTIPDYIHPGVKVRISDAADYGARDDSDAVFAIVGDVTVTAPVGGEQWIVDSQQTITWTSAGSITDVKIEYSTTGGASYNLIEGVPNSHSYLWTIPDTISASCRIRVSDLTYPDGNGVSTANFKIKAGFTLSAPNGGEIWTVGDAHNITWTNIGTVNNARLDYSTDGGTTYPSVIAASTANTGTYAWTVPDAISTQVRVRVGSATDVDAYDVSNANFKIRGAFQVTAPNGGELWRIALDYPIQWNTIGTIANVRILYSTDGGTTYPNTIVNSVANINSYTWHLPDTRTPTAKVQVVNPADTTVLDESDATFRIQGSLTMTAPNGGEEWISGDVHNITWNWGGTLPTVKLTYSINSGVTYPYTINAAAANGAGGEGAHSYAWTVPDTVASTCRVKIEDPDDSTVASASAADFKIRGGISITSPAGGERWVTNEVHNITWTDRGEIPTVKIQYSKDNFVADVHTIAAAAENTNSYAWTIPDDRSTTVKVRVTDTRDDTISGTSAGNVHIDYYTITWVLKDLLTNVGLTNLGVTEKATGTENVRWSQTGLTSPIVTQAPYGFWTTTWSATGYGDKGQNYTADSDQSFELYMETTAVHIWRAEARFSWNADTRELNATSWLERDGSIVTGVKSVLITIYDEDGTVITTMNAPTTSAEGYFTMVWKDTTNKLQAGVVYAALVDLMNLSDAHFKTPTSFSITETERLKNTEEAVNNMVNVTLPSFQATVQGTLNTGLAEQKDLIEEKMTEQTGLLVGDKTKAEILAAGGMVGMVQQSLTSFESSSNEAIQRLQSGADTAVEAGQELEATAKKYSWDASAAPNPALAGDRVTLSVQGQPGCLPMLSVYTWNNKPVMTDVILTESRPGFYTYEFNADSRFDVGKAYTYIVSEQSTGGLVSGSAMVESMGISTVAGLAAAAPEAERAAKKALDAIQAVEAVLVSKDNINIASTLQSLKSSVDELPAQIAKEGPNTQLTGAVNDISDKLNKLLGDEGVDLGTMLEEKLGGESTLKEMRNKTDTIQAVVDLLLQIMESKLGGVDEPIISESLQAGSVKFRIVVVNPSKIKVQTVKIKKYLPEEVQLKDIMDAGGLDLEYDSEKGIYYAYKNDVALQPGESRVFEVEVEDVWIIPETKITDLKKQVENALPRFKNTEFAARVEEMARTVPAVLEEMLKTQLDETVSREQHIGIYRQNLQTIKRVTEELARLDAMINPMKGTATPEVLEKSKFKINLPGKSTTWLIILVIIVFLGLLAGVFFFVWQAQMKSGQDAIKAAAKDAFPGQKPPEKK